MALNCSMLDHERVICNGTVYKLPEEPLTYEDAKFWIYLGVYVFLVLFAGKTGKF